jgi:hypothetical protein
MIQLHCRHARVQLTDLNWLARYRSHYTALRWACRERSVPKFGLNSAIRYRLEPLMPKLVAPRRLSIVK